VLASTVILGFESLMATFYCLRFESPLSWRARSPYVYPPETGWPSYTPQAVGSLFVVSCSSQGYGGGIQLRLHTVPNNNCPGYNISVRTAQKTPFFCCLAKGVVYRAVGTNHTCLANAKQRPGKQRLLGKNLVTVNRALANHRLGTSQC
jgi:hypothetical protein